MAGFTGKIAPVDILMTVEAGASDEPVLAPSGTEKPLKAGVGLRGVKGHVVAVPAKKGLFTHKKIRMVAPVGFVTVQAIFRHRGMLPGKRPPLLSMTLEAEFVYGVGPDHFIRAEGCPRAERTNRFGAEAAHGVMTARASEFLMGHHSLVHGVTGLFVRLEPDVSVAPKAEIGLFGFQEILLLPMNGVAVVAGNIRGAVPVHVPEGDNLGFLVAGKTLAGFGPALGFTGEGKHSDASSSSLFDVLTCRTVT